MKILDGVTIIDFTQAYSGPFCTMQLADFGARVIKIERKDHGDHSREWTPLKNGHSGYYAAINRNKESLSVDISRPEGQEIIKKLVKSADIVVENFKTGTLDKMGLGYAELSKINPGLVFASISGFGGTGPLKNLAAYDNVIQAMAGIMEMTGFPDGVPTRVGPAIGDSFTGLTTALAISMAYFHKLNTGEGQKIEVAMMDTIFSILESPILFSTLLDQEATRSGNNDAGTLVPYDVFACKDGYFSAGLASDSGWDKFCNVIGMPELIEDERFCDNELRCKNYAIITPIISKFFATRTRDELQQAFSAVGIPNAPVLSVPEAMDLPQIAARNMLVDMVDPGVGPYKAINNPIKLRNSPAVLEKGAPFIGQETDAILLAAGYGRDDIASLRQRDIV